MKQFFVGIVIICNVNLQARWFEYDRAILQAQRADFAGSLERLNRCLIDDPENPSLLYDAGVAAYSDGKHQLAADYFNRAATEAGARKDLQEHAYFNLGNAQVALKQLHEAVTSYEHALSIDPQDERAQHNLAAVKEMLKQQEQEQQKKDQEKKKDEQQQKDQDQKKDQKQQSKDQKQQQKDQRDQDQEQNKKDEQKKQEKDQQQDREQKNGEQEQSEDQQQDQKKDKKESKSKRNQEQRKRDEQAKKEKGEKGENEARDERGEKRDKQDAQRQKSKEKTPDQKSRQQEHDQKEEQERNDHKETPTQEEQEEKPSQQQDKKGSAEKQEMQSASLQEAGKPGKEGQGKLPVHQLDARMEQLLKEQEQSDARQSRRLIKANINQQLKGQYGEQCW